MKKILFTLITVLLATQFCDAGIKREIQDLRKAATKNLFVRPVYLKGDYYLLTPEYNSEKDGSVRDSLKTRLANGVIYVAKFRPQNEGKSRTIVTEEARIYVRDTLGILCEYKDIQQSRSTLIHYIEEAYPSSNGWMWRPTGENRCLRVFVGETKSQKQLKKDMKRQLRKSYDEAAVWHPLNEYSRPAPGQAILVKVKTNDGLPLLLTVLWDEETPEMEFSVKAAANGTFIWEIGSGMVLAWADINDILNL